MLIVNGSNVGGAELCECAPSGESLRNFDCVCGITDNLKLVAEWGSGLVVHGEHN